MKYFTDSFLSKIIDPFLMSRGQAGSSLLGFCAFMAISIGVAVTAATTLAPVLETDMISQENSRATLRLSKKSILMFNENTGRFGPYGPAILPVYTISFWQNQLREIKDALTGGLGVRCYPLYHVIRTGTAGDGPATINAAWDDRTFSPACPLTGLPSTPFDENAASRQVAIDYLNNSIGVREVFVFVESERNVPVPRYIAIPADTSALPTYNSTPSF